VTRQTTLPGWEGGGGSHPHPIAALFRGKLKRFDPPRRNAGVRGRLYNHIQQSKVCYEDPG
jgi:hypothetical protein